MAVVAVVVFMLLRLTTGDPAAIIAGDNATSQDVAAIREKLGLDRPLAEQFVIWLGRLARGDFGESFFFKKQVSELIAERVEPTLALATSTIVLTVLLAVPLGVLAAWRRGTWLDRLVMGFSVLGFSVPVFVIGYLLIYLFAIELAWVPVQGYQRLREGLGGFLVRLILPSITLAVVFVALIARITRASVLEVLNADYVRTARAKGLAELPVMLRHVLRNAAVPIVTVIGVGIAVLIGLLAPVLATTDPAQIDPTVRNRRPGAERTVRADDGRPRVVKVWMGTDTLGRDVYSRVLYGARVSLVVGVTVALVSAVLGLLIGLLAGYLRWLDGIVMRVMDGLMAIPSILLAIGLVSLSRAGLRSVILAIVIPEVPRVVRLVRALVLSLREEPYVEAAVALGARTPALLARHVLPNTLAPLVVQSTFVCASAILLEAILSFLGVGIPPETPTWGNIMAEGRALFRVFPHNILFPGIFLAATVLAVNMLGDGLRDRLDPRVGRRL